MKFWTHEISDYEARAIMFSHKLIVTENSVYEVRKNGNGFSANVIYTEKRPRRKLAAKGNWFIASRNVIEGWLGIKMGEENV